MAKDYVSNIPGPDVRPYFKHAIPYKSHPNPAHHLVLCDPELSAGCGYVSRDEGAILWECARRTLGLVPAGATARIVEIGSHTGWSTAHLAAHEGVHVDAIEPEFSRVAFNATGSPLQFLNRCRANLEAWGVLDRVTPHGTTSQEFLPQQPSGGYVGAFVDGEHEPPFPANDAAMVIPRMAESCFIAFHDVLGWPVQNGVKVCIDAGFKWRLYKTPQLMAVCWRGDFVPPDHTPDPLFNWDNWINRSLRFEIDLDTQS